MARSGAKGTKLPLDFLFLDCLGNPNGFLKGKTRNGKNVFVRKSLITALILDTQCDGSARCTN